MTLAVNSEIEAVIDILRGALSRQIADAEMDQLRRLLPNEQWRFAVAEALQDNETRIASETVRRFLTQFPNFVNEHDSARAKCLRDKQFYLRSLASAMILGDVDLIEQEVKIFFIADEWQVKVPPNMISESWRHTAEVIQKTLPAELTPEVFRLIHYTQDLLAVGLALNGVSVTDPRRRASFHLHKHDAACAADAALRFLGKRSADFGGEFADATREKGAREMRLLVRSVAHAIVVESRERFREAVSEAVRAPFARTGRQFSASDYAELVGCLKAALNGQAPAETMELANPLLQEAMDVCANL
jgi:hypothetical protein